MTPSQVRYILGSPLIKDTFNQNRWDYNYRVKKGTEISNVKQITLFFAEEKLERIEHSADTRSADAAVESAAEESDDK